jgi:disulfide bond formation protein DsbB
VKALLAGGRPFAALVVLGLGAVGLALITQHGFEMLPCPWCILQRMIFVAIAIAALPGALLASPAVRKASAALVLLLALAGVAAALWQHFVAASSASCDMTLADRIVTGSGLDALLPGVFAPWTSCADGAAKLLGVPYEFYSLTLFALSAVVATWLLRRRG